MAVNQEIERKFLVSGDYRPYVTRSKQIKQGYLSKSIAHTVRIRISDNQAFLTIKGRSNRSGLARLEWEVEVDYAKALRLFALCDPHFVIDKTRHMVPQGALYFEVDEFHGANWGLTVAEIELLDERQPFDRPDWLGQEVTGEKRYYNSQLAKNPYSLWKK